MATAQSTYSENIAAATAGLVANSTPSRIDTRVCETAAGIGFGVAVSHGSNDKGAVIGGALVDFSGISVRDVTLDPANPDEYQQYDNMAVMTEGDIWVVPAVEVSEGDAVHYNATTGALTNTGGNGPIVGARWMTSGTGMAIVRLGGGMPAAT